MAVYVDVAPSTIAAELERDEKFLRDYQRALMTRELSPLADLRAASKKSWRAAAWLLQKTGGGKYLRRQ